MEERGKEEIGEAGCNFTGGLDTRTIFLWRQGDHVLTAKN
jgi:hypothetical protein